MTGRRRLGLVAAGATLLSSAPLATIFDKWTWLLQVILTVVMIAGAGVLTRTLRFPSWAQALGMVVAMLVTLTWIFPSGHELLVPTPATIAHFGELIQQAGQDTRSYAVPVPDRDGLLFVAALGIGVVAIVVDLLTAVFRRPALAGLPMLAIYSIPVAVYLDSVPVTPFIIGACGYLWLLVADNVDRVRRFGRRFTGDGRDVDVWEPSPLAAAGRRLGLVGVLVAVLLPLIVPTVSGGLLSQLTQSGTGAGTGVGPGGSGKIDLFAKLSGQLSQNATVNLLKVTTNEKDPFYLRFGVADQLTAEGFGNQQPNGNTLNKGSLPDPRRDGATLQTSFQQYHADIEVTDALRQNMAPLYSYPVGISDLTGSWAYDGSQQVLYSNRNTTSKQKYSIDYLRAQYTPAELRTALSLNQNDPIRRAYTVVPVNAYVNQQVAKLTKGKTNDYDKVRSIYDSFSKKYGFSYSLSTQPAGNVSEIEAFLKNKVGYCQQYAAAMAWMVRAAGIPARVAFGFTRGTPEDGDTYVITNRNAHAWTEVYLQGFGWVPFDATPSAGVAGSTRSDWAPDVDRTTAPSATGTTAPATGASGSASAGPNQRPDKAADGDNPSGTGVVAPDQNNWTGLLIFGLVATLIALLLVPALRRVLLRRQRHAATAGPPPAVINPPEPGPAGAVTGIVVSAETTQARADAHAAWDELIDTMVDYQITVDPTETPRLTAQRLIREAVLTEQPAAAAELLGTAEERARYARQPMQGAELTSALRQVRSGMAHSVNTRVRLRAVLLPPSIMLSWRLGLAEAGTRSMEVSGRFGEWLTRFNPRRLLNRAR
ncbi:transglutaminaseTgpA domain-containing protein [Actinoplanes sp. HUAS TT8]|uniref:transglutaminaseTgpA domain-containing protein n=1 Tax=Actinoplanes sp. HUAS TT8 TaxID=3447453 RepID=UPI003F51E1C8